MHKFLIAALAIAAAAACSSSPTTDDAPGSATSTPDAGASSEAGAGPGFGGAATAASLVVSPAQATIESLDGAKVTQAFTVVAKDANGAPVSLGVNDVVWTVSNPQPGSVDGAGRYTANGTLGGSIKVTATAGNLTATADLTVKLHLVQRQPGFDAGAESALKGATNSDPAVKLASPYDGTVFPRGLNAPPLMWTGGAGTDAYELHITSPTFELELFGTPGASFYVVDQALWNKFVDSTSGAAHVDLMRYDGQAATVVAKHTWTIAPASMRGTIYYWSNYKGRVLRIKPGATEPDDFSAGVLQPGTTPMTTCTMTCHTVSADGSTLVSGGEILGGSYDLIKNAPVYDVGAAPGTDAKAAWGISALSPDGAYVLKHGGSDGLFKTSDGTHVATTGFEGTARYYPAFAPDGSGIAYVGFAQGAQTGDLRFVDFDTKSLTASNDRLLVGPGSTQGQTYISYPSVSPDGRWVVFERGISDDSRGVDHCQAWDASGKCTQPIFDYTNRARLSLADAKNPGVEIPLDALNGEKYPFVAGDRDRNWSFEPTFAPVAAGGYFWVVFTSRRTYGIADAKDANCVANPPAIYGQQAGPDIPCTKHLWVAAIDQNPTPGKDPSHPAFFMPGQELNSMGMRGYWALDPCKADGAACGSGTECCGGFCHGSDDGGGAVCRSAKPVCAQNGDRCSQTSDCCSASSGAVCINHVCTEGVR